ncbi:hypothetical protein GCM10028775_76520 [Catellatospora paridis]
MRQLAVDETLGLNRGDDRPHKRGKIREYLPGRLGRRSVVMGRREHLYVAEVRPMNVVGHCTDTRRGTNERNLSCLQR